eukprot:430847-Rhodomonas_salina.2
MTTSCVLSRASNVLLPTNATSVGADAGVLAATSVYRADRIRAKCVGSDSPSATAAKRDTPQQYSVHMHACITARQAGARACRRRMYARARARSVLSQRWPRGTLL